MEANKDMGAGKTLWFKTRHQIQELHWLVSCCFLSSGFLHLPENQHSEMLNSATLLYVAKI